MKTLILAFSLFIFWGHSYGKSSKMVLPLLMPKIDPKTIQEDDYKCTAFKLSQNESQYITEFKPNASDPIPLHHLMIYGCENPADPRGKTEQDYVWSCSDVHSTMCGSGEMQLLYVWSKNAATFKLPKSVGFKVGGNTKINYLVLHVHYFKVDLIKEPEDSGFFLTMIPESAHRITRRAGFFSLFSDSNDQKRAVIPAKSSINFENACPLNDSKELHLIAVRPNTNPRGKLVTGWLIHQNRRGRAEWTLIGKYNPNPYQDFNPVHNKNLVIKPKDWVAMRCVAVNNNSYPIYYGQKDTDETCNIYIIYSVGSDKSLDENICNSFGPPYYTWESDPNLPGGSVPDWVDKESSTFIN